MPTELTPFPFHHRSSAVWQSTCRRGLAPACSTSSPTWACSRSAALLLSSPGRSSFAALVLCCASHRHDPHMHMKDSHYSLLINQKQVALLLNSEKVRLIETKMALQIMAAAMERGNDALRLRACDVLLAAGQHDPQPLRLHIEGAVPGAPPGAKPSEDNRRLLGTLIATLGTPNDNGLQEQVRSLNPPFVVDKRQALQSGSTAGATPASNCSALCSSTEETLWQRLSLSLAALLWRVLRQ
jgi:hypothetical protein